MAFFSNRLRFFGYALLVVFCCASFANADDLTKIDLPDRPEPADTTETDSSESDWMASDSSAADTVEYHAVDLQYDVESSTFNLNDKAQLKYRTATLDADTILYDQQNEILMASGDPVMKEPKNPSLAGYRMKYNMKTRIGEIYYATTYQDNQQLNGMEVRRLPDTRLLIARGDFSTCDDTTHQHYYFYGRRMVVKPKESVTARPVVLNIADVPVAVLPMIVAPLKSGRRSGLLTPKFGGDQVQGFYIKNVGFYYAPNDYWDATTSGDIIEGSNANFEKTTLTEGIRYKIRYKLDGNISFTSYLEEFDMANSGYDISFSHNQNLTPDGKHSLSGSGSFVSSQSVRKDNALDAETILNQQANAQMTYSGKFDNNKSLTLKTVQQYNLTTGTKERQIPDIQYRMSGPLFDSDDEDSEEASEGSFLDKFNYSYSNRANLYEKIAKDSVNDVDTTAWYVGYTDNLSVDYSGSLFDVINLTPKAAYKGMWSGRSWINPEDSAKYRRARSSVDPSQSEYGEYFYNHNYSLTADTKLYGIWMPEIGRFTGVRHVLSPSVSYTYAPEIDTNKYFVPHPLLGQTPYQSEQKTIGFSLSNDFDIKYLKIKGRSADMDKGDSSETDDVYGTRRLLTTTHSTSYNFAADSLNWSDISSSFGLQVLPNYLFTIRTVHSFYHKYENDPNKVRFPELTQYSYELSKSFKWSGDLNSGLPSQLGKYKSDLWSAGFDYRYTFSSKRVGKKVFKETISHSSSISASLHPTPNWEMTYSTRYDYTDGKFATHEFTFNRTLHCWKIDFTWTPTGPASGWSFSIYVKDLPDIRLNAASTDD
ncbi:MAG: LPS-assembly protein LptD [Fibrobacteraceae bacterium]|nr:LPS-assembly protein LptD [Fibrobacteraceae bacterium]